ncbi:MAG: hypothetical protein QXE92_03700 [Thermofilaceae archaeon]
MKVNSWRRLLKSRVATAAVSKIIGLVIAVVLIASLVPTAIQELLQVQTTNWGAAGVLWGVVPVIVVLAIFLLILKTTGIMK